MNDLAVGAASAVVCGLAGLAMPRVVARLPEPEPEVFPALEPGEELSVREQARRDEPPKEPYAAMAVRGGFGTTLAYFSLVAGALVGGRVGLHGVLLLLLPLVPVGVTLAVIDLRTRLLPAVLVRPCLAAALLYGVVAWPLTDSAESLVRGLVGMVAAWVLFFVAWFVQPRGMGWGDVRLAGLLGFVLAYLGWAELVVGLYSPFLLFGLPGLAVAVVRWDRRLLKIGYPFGPALLAGALLGVVAGGAIADAFVG